MNDPLTVAPVGKVLDLAKGIPGVKPVLKAASDVAGNTVGRALNPQEYLRGLTPEAQAEFEVATNRAMTTVRQQKEAEDKIVAAHADEIRQGKMPDEIARLFTGDKSSGAMDAWKQYFPKGLKPGTRPQDVVSALFQNRAKVFKTQAMEELEKQGFFTSADAIRAGAPSKFTAPLDEIPDLQEHLRSVVENKITPESKNILVKGARTLTHRGNQAFLANPAPHAGNLANLAYNKYGPITALQGLGNAARVATGTVGKGKLAQNIGELESLGAKSQYGNIFDELGLTRLAGIPGTEGAAKVANRALIPLQRASNYAQHKILNSTETGLRSAALDAEKRAGRTGPQAAQSIHKTFGTDAPNAVTHGLQQLAVPFAQFHWQTAPGSVANTLLRNPARISNPIKAEQDLNNRRGPQYRSTVPGANALAWPPTRWATSPTSARSAGSKGRTAFSPCSRAASPRRSSKPQPR